MRRRPKPRPGLCERRSVGEPGLNSRWPSRPGSIDRDVAVAEDDEVGGREASTEPALPSLAGTGIVDHADAQAVDREEPLLGKLTDEVVVVVAEDGDGGGEPGQLLEQRAGDDVAGVEHEVGLLQRGVDGGR